MLNQDPDTRGGDAKEFRSLEQSSIDIRHREISTGVQHDIRLGLMSAAAGMGPCARIRPLTSRLCFSAFTTSWLDWDWERGSILDIL
jgi:hypothetical protein